jgi:hypothetical protein
MVVSFGPAWLRRNLSGCELVPAALAKPFMQNIKSMATLAQLPITSLSIPPG